MFHSLICPSCRARLDEPQSNRCSCSGCGRTYPVEDGVVRLLEQTDEFYEGAYHRRLGYVPRSESPWHAWPLWLLPNGYAWAVREYVPQGSIVVELGCAGGVRYFSQRYHMIGCDISFGSLKQVVEYERLVQADATQCIPLPDSSVDAVVSSFFWEHIPPACKPALLAECRRILRPRGKIVFVYDVETSNPLLRHYKEKDKALYNKLFIEGDGHWGYERPVDNVATFEAAGFRILQHEGQEKTFFQSPAAYEKLAEFGGPERALYKAAAKLTKAPWHYPYAALIRVIDEVVCPFLSDDWSRIDLVVAQR